MHELIPPDVVLDEETHTYTLLSCPDLRLRSCTEFINSFFEPFNGRMIAKKLISNYPKYSNRTVSSLLAEWKRLEQVGTATHVELAACINSSDKPKTAMAKQALTWLHRAYPPTEFEYLAERQICSPTLTLAGTIDLLVRSRSTAEFVLIDWKTNKKLDRTPYKGKKGVRGPARRLGDCHFVKYGLQLTLYRYILDSQYGIEIARQFLVHIPGPSIQAISVRYAKADVTALLQFEGLLPEAGRI